MFTSFSTALSALSADSTAIDVVGNNLANLNTTGFKASEVSFRDLVTESLGAGLGETQVGFGVGTPLTVRQFTQGAIQTTSGVLDAAIQGDGFFVVQGSTGNTLYSRDGNFQDGRVGKSAEPHTGWQSAGGGRPSIPLPGEVDTNGPIGNIVVPVGSLKPPVATSKITDDLNLNSNSAADSTSSFSTPITVYDSLGTSHVLTLNFQKTGDNQWSYQLAIPGDDVSGGTAGTAFDISGASGTLNFDTAGQLSSPADGSPIAFSVSGFSDGASDMNLTWTLYNSDGTGRITQFGEDSNSSANSQNGSPPAELDNVGLADGGQILAKYSDSTQVVVGQVAVASIRNPETLIAAGNNSFQLSALTANPSIGVPGPGGRGTIAGGATEASTVDIATEFTNLIVYQRAYEANAHVITTADQLSQDTINLIH